MGKNNKISPNVARILAEKIVDALQEQVGTEREYLQKINDEVNTYPEVKKGLQLQKELASLNTKIQQKSKKWFHRNYQEQSYFSTTKEDKQWASNYWLNDWCKIPSVDSIKDEIVLESAFSEADSPEEIISAYIKKYTPKPTKK